MRLLVVEDNAELSQQLRNTLSESGFAVDVATDGEEGLHLGSSSKKPR
jgi:two-component system OmpR family response regulator